MKPKHADVIIIGLGAMGTAAAYQCARAGLRVIGLEQFRIGHDKGSSHGKSRVIRKAYFEDPRYVPLLHDAYEGWRMVERASGKRLLNLVGCLNMGPAEHEAMRGVQASVREHNLPHELLTRDQIHRRWPFFEPAEHDVGVFEADAGFICPEDALRCMADLARQGGAELHEETIVKGWLAKPGCVTVPTRAGDYEAEHVIITAGAWLPGMILQPAGYLQIERQVQAWFRPLKPEMFAKSNMPTFIHFCDCESFYGIPPSEASMGLKIARHHGGATTTADTVDRVVNGDDDNDIRRYMRKHMPAADGVLLDSKVCLYTNTPDSHFIIDQHPEHANVHFAGGFSGHGFKFAPVIGKVLASFVRQERISHDLDMFKISRFDLRS